MVTSQRLKTALPAILLGLIAGIAFLSAQGVSNLVAQRLGLGANVLSMPLARAALPAGPAPFHATSAAAILARNPFDSVRGPLLDGPKGDDAPASDPDVAPSCDDVKVLAIVASDDADWSFAALQTGAQPPMLRRRGGEVANKTVAYIGWERVWMESGGRFCQAAMFSETPAVATVADAGAPAAAPTTPLEATLAKGVQRRSATEFDVDRSVLDQVLEHQAELLGRTHIALDRDKASGRSAGVRLSGIAPGALLGVLGIENGDQLQTINGFDITNPTTALEALARLQQSPKLAVVLNRGGKAMTLDYNVK